jgi:hypothetical protein
MGKRVTIKEAVILTGLSEGELRRGVKSHKYPCMFVGTANKKVIFDIDLLEAHLEKLALENMMALQDVQTAAQRSKIKLV